MRLRWGLEERLKDIPQEKHQEYRDRLQKEIDIIDSMKFPGYMLIVWDLYLKLKRWEFLWAGERLLDKRGFSI